MKRKRYTEPQIVFALQQAESGTSVSEICRKMGVSENRFYRWKKRYGGLGVLEIRRLRQLEDENKRLKQVVADLRRCCRMCCEKKTNACPPPGAGCLSRGGL